jgi:hypothetical protein
MHGGDSHKIYAETQYPEACMTWLEYLLSDDVLARYSGESLGLPIRPITPARTPDKVGFADFSNTEIDSLFPPRFQFSQPEPGYGNYLNQIMTGDITIDEAIETLNVLYNAAIDEAISAGDDPASYIYPNFDFMDPAGSSAK